MMGASGQQITWGVLVREALPILIQSATVTIITDENTPSERQQTFVVPMRKAGDLTLLRSFTMK